MQIYIKKLNGVGFVIETDDFIDIYSLKVNLEHLTGFKLKNQRLLFCGQELKNEQKISEIIGLEEHTNIHLVYVEDYEINIKEIPITHGKIKKELQGKIIEELKTKVLYLEDRIDKLEIDRLEIDKSENKEKIETKKEDTESDKLFKKWVSEMIFNLDSGEGRNNLKNKTINYNDNGEFSITYEYKT